MKRLSTVLALSAVFIVALWAQSGPPQSDRARPSPAGPAQAAPPNDPAQIVLEGNTLRIRYNGATIFDGRIENPAAVARATVNAYRRKDAVDQVVALTAASSRTPVSPVWRGHGQRRGVSGGVRPPAARHSHRPSQLRAEPQPPEPVGLRPALGLGRCRSTIIRARRSASRPWRKAPERRTFAIEASGGEVLLRFRPRFYQQHRGLSFFEPWTYAIWPKPIVGWCSWFAFFDRVTEADIRQTADVVAEVLAPFGYEYIQMDDGYQRATGRAGVLAQGRTRSSRPASAHWRTTSARRA